MDLNQLETFYINLYKEYHLNPKHYKGKSTIGEPVLPKFIAKYGCKSGLDFGCAKANTDEQILKNVGLETIDFYDPAVPKYSKLPNKAYDVVICTDVLEHIPIALLPRTLNKIWKRTSKFTYIGICTRKAKAILPNGENAHCTVKSNNWWIQFIKELAPPTLTVVLSFKPKQQVYVIRNK